MRSCYDELAAGQGQVTPDLLHFFNPVTKGENVEGDGISVKRWAAAKGERHLRALGLLTQDDVKIIRRGLSAEEQIKGLSIDVGAKDAIEKKLDRIVASSEAAANDD